MNETGGGDAYARKTGKLFTPRASTYGNNWDERKEGNRRREGSARRYIVECRRAS